MNFAFRQGYLCRTGRGALSKDKRQPRAKVPINKSCDLKRTTFDLVAADTRLKAAPKSA
jgi:hypothetical protein